jgi:hypothetical protein
MSEIYVCDTCHQPLQANETVVDAAQLHDVTTQESTRKEYIEGMHAFFHPSHVTHGWMEKGRGPLSQFIKPGS